MLNPDNLEKQIKNALEQYLPPAFEGACLTLMPSKSENGDEIAKVFGQTV